MRQVYFVSDGSWPSVESSFGFDLFAPKLRAARNRSALDDCENFGAGAMTDQRQDDRKSKEMNRRRDWSNETTARQSIEAAGAPPFYRDRRVPYR
jgi:hypothetical protein